VLPEQPVVDEDRRRLAARVICASSGPLRDTLSEYTVVTVTGDGRAHAVGTVFDRHSSAIAEATRLADTSGVLAYSVRRNADDSFTVYGGTTQIATLNVSEASRAA
jgi:hypothetical protein